jgi:hypothetical protein
MKAMFAILLATSVIAGAAVAQEDPDQSFTPGPPPANQTPIPPGPTGADDSVTSASSNGAQLTAAMIGDVLEIDELDGAWVGAWTRRPGTDVFDAVWRNRQGQEAHDVVRLVGVSRGQVTFRRDGQSGAPGDYTGTLGADGRTIIGMGSWYQPGWIWKAVIQGDGAQTTSRDGGNQHRPQDQGSREHPGGQPPTEAQLTDNWNTGGCGLTDTATLDLDAPTHLTRVALWYNWRAGEDSVRYSVLSGGRQVSDGTLTRGGCDPHQSAWCEARDTPDAALDAGQYSFHLESARLCQNDASGRVGFIRAWGYRTGGTAN